MADTKISALPASTTPLAGAEVLPIVQSSTTKQVSVANLTAGRDVSVNTLTSTVATGTAPFTVASTTQVANLNAATAGTASNLKSNATTGVMQIVGPAAASTRVMTIPDANFTAARTDAAQTFNGTQTLNTSDLYFTNPANSTSVVREIMDYVNSPATTAVSNRLSIGIRQADSLPNRGASVRFYQTGTTEGGGYASTYISFWTYRLGYDNGKECWRVDQSGDFVQAASGYGINFTANTPTAGMTSQLLNWYEEGDWTPVITPGSGSITTQTNYGKYTRIGRTVTIIVSLATSNIGTASGTYTVSLPFTAFTPSNGRGGTCLVREDNLTGQAYQGWVIGGSSTMRIETLTGTNPTWANNQQFTFTLTYIV